MDKNNKLAKLKEVYSPTAPIKRQDLFFGRITQLDSVCSAINEIGQHAILFGERGVGKTSLGNIIATQLTNVYPVKVTCSRNDDFKSLWQAAFRKVPVSKTTNGTGFNAEKKIEYSTLAEQLNQFEIPLPAHVEQIMQTLQTYRFLFVFDEFDNILKNGVRSQFADLIKALSDNCENITVVIIGISENVQNLIGNHPSLERCMKQIKMPRMNSEELGAIIDNGINSLELKIGSDIRKKIIDFSTGFPHYTHLLCKYGCKNAIDEDSDYYLNSHLQTAINSAIENVQEHIKETYRKATFSSAQESQWEQVLFASALSTTDEYNCFTTKEIITNFSSLSGKPVNKVNITYNLGKLCQEDRGEILEKIEVDGRVKYRFTNPLSKPYVILKMSKT